MARANSHSVPLAPTPLQERGLTLDTHFGNAWNSFSETVNSDHFSQSESLILAIDEVLTNVGTKRT